MIRSPHLLAIVATFAACSAEPPTTSRVEQALDRVINGSFETGDYTGWTLLESSGTATNGTFGIAVESQTINPNDAVFDFNDGVSVNQTSPGLPITYDATDGVQVALQLQNGGERHRMYQAVTLPTCGSFVRWDMAYTSHAALDATAQYFAVNVRDNADSVLATPLKTGGADPAAVAAMSPFQIDVSAFDGQTIRLDFELQAAAPFDIAWDHIRVECDNPPVVSPSLPSHDFGDVPVGASTAPQSITLTNTGPSDLDITSITTSAPFAVTTAALPLTLIPNDMTTIMATFTPTAGGPASDAIAIVSNEQDSPTLITLSGNGLEPVLTPDATSFPFPPQRVGTTGPPLFIGVTNTGNVDLTITSAIAAGPFAVTQPTNVVLPPQNSTSFEVSFTPTVAGPVMADLVITSDAAGSPTILQLTGFGTTGMLEVTPTSLAFGNIRAGLASVPQPVAVRNVGSAPLQIAGVGSPLGFAIDATVFPVTLLPGAESVFEVIFQPPDPGASGGDLVVDTSQGPANVAVSGSAVASALVADVAQLDLGTTAPGVATNRVLVTLTNVTLGPVAIEAAMLTDSQFVLDPSPPTIPIPPGGDVVFGVRFVPNGEGPARGRLDIVLQGAPGIDLTIDVDASGVTEGGGCCSSSGSPSSVWLALAVLALVRRRRPHDAR